VRSVVGARSVSLPSSARLSERPWQSCSRVSRIRSGDTRRFPRSGAAMAASALASSALCPEPLCSELGPLCSELRPLCSELGPLCSELAAPFSTLGASPVGATCCEVEAAENASAGSSAGGSPGWRDPRGWTWPTMEVCRNSNASTTASRLTAAESIRGSRWLGRAGGTAGRLTRAVSAGLGRRGTTTKAATCLPCRAIDLAQGRKGRDGSSRVHQRSRGDL